MLFEFRELRGRFVVRAAVGAPWGSPIAVLVCRKIQVEEGGVEFATEAETTFVVPTKRRAVVATVVRERLKVPGCERQLQDTREQPVRVLPPALLQGVD